MNYIAYALRKKKVGHAYMINLFIHSESNESMLGSGVLLSSRSDHIVTIFIEDKDMRLASIEFNYIEEYLRQLMKKLKRNRIHKFGKIQN